MEGYKIILYRTKKGKGVKNSPKQPWNRVEVIWLCSLTALGQMYRSPRLSRASLIGQFIKYMSTSPQVENINGAEFQLSSI